MNDYKIRVYAFEEAKRRTPGASLGELLEAARQIYSFITAGPVLH